SNPLRPACAHPHLEACWSWWCGCGAHGHLFDPRTRLASAADHPSGGRACGSPAFLHMSPLDCPAC
ncbi:MAG TPA: hypothetical protein VFH47_05395, partial [Candidatus Thermoplasmatota archaeon]|nr:hypothetical protein [Candidatus Thermoplasmatota archaeon]